MLARAGGVEFLLVFLKLWEREKESAKMEQLRKLEQVQRTMTLMESGGCSTNHQDSDRFLANLILLLVCYSDFYHSYICRVVGACRWRCPAPSAWTLILCLTLWVHGGTHVYSQTSPSLSTILCLYFSFSFLFS